MAGALKRILREEQYEIVALSGTSGGAICAFLTWYALLENDRAKAEELLDSFWRDNSAEEPLARLWNDWTIWETRTIGSQVVVGTSPYSSPVSSWVRKQLRETLEGQPVNFENFQEHQDSTSPVLLIDAIDIVLGESKIFDSRSGEIGIDALLATTAAPPLFKAMHIGDGVYWEALFLEIPPIRDLCREQPDEVWVIKVIHWSRGFEPKSIVDILDRRNELSGNISLYQEIRFVERINELVDKSGEGENKEDKRLRLPGEEGKEYRHIELRLLDMSEEMHQKLDFASKLDRNPSFIRELMDYGEEQAEEFLKG